MQQTADKIKTIHKLIVWIGQILSKMCNILFAVTRQADICETYGN